MWCVCELSPKERKIYFRVNWLKVLGIRGAAELIWGFGEHKQNTFRELRQKFSGIWGDQSIIFRELGSKDPPGGLHSFPVFISFFTKFPKQNSRAQTPRPVASKLVLYYFPMSQT